MGISTKVMIFMSKKAEPLSRDNTLCNVSCCIHRYSLDEHCCKCSPDETTTTTETYPVHRAVLPNPWPCPPLRIHSNHIFYPCCWNEKICQRRQMQLLHQRQGRWSQLKEWRGKVPSLSCSWHHSGYLDNNPRPDNAGARKSRRNLFLKLWDLFYVFCVS